MERKRLKADIILIAALAGISALAFGLRAIISSGGEYAAVYKDGALYGRYPLSEDAVVVIGDGTEKNTVIIGDGKAYMESASCPDGICVRTGSADKTGESVICLPNRVEIRIEGGEREADIG